MSAFITRCVHAGRSDLKPRGVHAPPIDLSSTNPLVGIDSGGEAYERLASGQHGSSEKSHVYGRLWNPTVARFEEALAELEGCAQSVAFASGMAALAACLLATAQDGGGHVVGIRPMYGGSEHLLQSGLLGTQVEWTTAERLAGVIRPDTGLVVVETPANPSLDLVDIGEIVSCADPVPVLVDNTFATPVLQRPATLGAQLVLHSATKFLGGHGDVIGGVVATNDVWAARLRRVRIVTGGILHPLAGYLLHRGLQTLSIRVLAQQEGARSVAGWLHAQPDIVAAVHYPDEHRLQTDLDGQMSGPGSVLSFEVRGGRRAAAQVAMSCRLITHAVSLGGVDSLIEHPASLTHRIVDPACAPSDALLRLSVGLEDPADLIADLAHGLDQARAMLANRTVPGTP